MILVQYQHIYINIYIYIYIYDDVSPSLMIIPDSLPRYYLCSGLLYNDEKDNLFRLCSSDFTKAHNLQEHLILSPLMNELMDKGKTAIEPSDAKPFEKSWFAQVMSTDVVDHPKLYGSNLQAAMRSLNRLTECMDLTNHAVQELADKDFQSLLDAFEYFRRAVANTPGVPRARDEEVRRWLVQATLNAVEWRTPWGLLIEHLRPSILDASVRRERLQKLATAVSEADWKSVSLLLEQLKQSGLASSDDVTSAAATLKEAQEKANTIIEQCLDLSWLKTGRLQNQQRAMLKTRSPN
jgi:hypothetical protein